MVRSSVGYAIIVTGLRLNHRASLEGVFWLHKLRLASILAALVLLLTTGSAVLAFLYRAPVAITENASTPYTMLAVSWNQNNTWLASNGFMASTANDTRVQTLGGSNKPWMVADNKTLTAVPVPAASQTNLYFVTGESAASTMDIIVGYSGYITRADAGAASWELGANFSIEMDGYFNTSTTDNIVSKASAFRTYVPSAGTVAVLIDGVTSWTLATSDDGGAQWNNEANAYDNNTVTKADNLAVPASSWGDFLVFNLAAPVFADQVRFYAQWRGAGYLGDFDIYDGTSWVDVFQAVFTDAAWNTVAVSYPASAIKYRFRFYNADPVNPQNFDLFEAQVNAGLGLSVAASTGEHNINVTATGGTTNLLGISVDGAAATTVALAGASVANNGNSWVLMSNQTPYWNYYKHTVGGTLVGWYQPASVILTTVMPDRAGAAQNGVITWGANPAGVGVVLGSMTSSGQSSIGGGSDTSTGDILPPVGKTDWRPAAVVSAALQANPMRPIVTAISDNTTLSEYQVWVWLGIILVVFITVLVGANVRGHHLITGIAASAAIILMVVWTVFPLLSLLVVVLAVWGGLVSERSPSL